MLDDLARQITQGRSESGTDGYRAGNTPEALADRVHRLRAEAGARGVADGNTPEALVARVERLARERRRDQPSSEPHLDTPSQRGPRL